MAHRTLTQQVSKRSSRIMRSVPAENTIDTGSARTRTTGPDGKLPIALTDNARETSIESLNQLLADTMTLRDLYKKHHWQVAGPWFYPLHLLFDKHFQEQAELVDEIAERIRILGGISVAMAHDVAEATQIPRPPMGRESTEQQIQRLLEAHEIILLQSHAAAKQADEAGDDGTNDLIVSNVIRTNELQTWFVGEHLALAPGAPSDDA
jgi:starvation-inducible DNA-binding protein